MLVISCLQPVKGWGFQHDFINIFWPPEYSGTYTNFPKNCLLPRFSRFFGKLYGSTVLSTTYKTFQHNIWRYLFWPKLSVANKFSDQLIAAEIFPIFWKILDAYEFMEYLLNFTVHEMTLFMYFDLLNPVTTDFSESPLQSEFLRRENCFRIFLISSRLCDQKRFLTWLVFCILGH